MVEEHCDGGRAKNTFVPELAMSGKPWRNGVKTVETLAKTPPRSLVCSLLASCGGLEHAVRGAQQRGYSARDHCCPAKKWELAMPPLCRKRSQRVDGDFRTDHHKHVADGD